MATEAEIRQKLEPEYVTMFQSVMGMSLGEAREAFEHLIAEAKKNSIEKKLGDVDAHKLYSMAQTNDNVRWQLDWKAQQGVREEDFAWWWNMPDLERQVLLVSDTNNRNARYIALRESGVSAEDAAADITTTIPILHEFLAKSQDHTSIHCPLPVELKARVVQFTEREMSEDPSGEQLGEKVLQAGSFNAVIRNGIREGSI